MKAKTVFIFMENAEKKALIKEILNLLNYLAVEITAAKEVKALKVKRKVILTDKKVIENYHPDIIKKFNNIYCFLDYSETSEKKEKVVYERDLIKIDILKKHLK